jgi:peptidyl-prolyl cis-trans isomerase
MNIMKKLHIFLIFAVIAAVFTTGCNGKTDEKTEEKKTEQEDSAESEKPAEVTPEQLGYAFGVIIGQTAKDNDLKMNLKELIKGFKAGSSDSFKDSELTEAQMLINQAYYQAHEARVAKNLEESKKFLEENKKREGVNVTDSGLQYEVLQPGKNGNKPLPTDSVEVNYKGYFTDNTVFDDSYKHGKPVKISLSKVIPAWTEGLPLMTEGSKYKFFIPPELGYGEQGVRDNNSGQVIIPGNALLIFEIELVSIDRSKQEPAKK